MKGVPQGWWPRNSPRRCLWHVSSLPLGTGPLAAAEWRRNAYAVKDSSNNKWRMADYWERRKLSGNNHEIYVSRHPPPLQLIRILRKTWGGRLERTQRLSALPTKLLQNSKWDQINAATAIWMKLASCDGQPASKTAPARISSLVFHANSPRNKNRARLARKMITIISWCNFVSLSNKTVLICICISPRMW